MNKLKLGTIIAAFLALFAFGVACTNDPTATAVPGQSTGVPQTGTGIPTSPGLPPVDGVKAPVGAPGSVQSIGTASYAYPQQVGSQQSGIWVSGLGKVTTKPDLAILTLGVESREKTVSDATSKAASAMNAIVDALKKYNIPDKDVQTKYYNVTPDYQYVQTVEAGVTRGKQILVGYIVNNSVSVKIRNLDNVGRIIDDVTKAGGDLTRINGITFTVENTTALTTQARELAVKDALAKAKQFADLTGVTLGKLQYIAESGGAVPVVRAAAEFAMAPAAAGSTPISAGEMELQVSVQAVFNIQ